MPSNVIPYVAPYVLEDTLGSRGPTAQRFQLPAAATSLWSGQHESEMAIVEASRVTVLTPSGQLKRTLHAPLSTQGGRGVSSRPFTHPMGITAHGPDLIVADTYNHRLLRMRVSDGRPLSNATHAQEHFGSGTSNLRYPRGVAVVEHAWPPHASMPILYVADSGNSRVCALALAPSTPSLGSTPTITLPGPVSTAKDAAMVPLLCFGSHGSAPASLSGPSAVAVAHMEGLGPDEGKVRLFIADTHNDRVSEWAFSAGTTRYDHVRNLGGTGTAPGLFHRPVGIALLLSPQRDHARSRLFVAEREGRRAQVFTASGRHLQVLTPPVPGRLGGVALATRGHVDQAFDDHRIVLIGRERSRIFVYRRVPKPSPRFEHPRGHPGERRVNRAG